MDNHQVFDLWLKQFPLGWLPIALSQQRQIFMVIDLRYYEGRYLYVMANSREDVMKWILSPENEILRNISYKNNKKITWFYSEKFKRGKIRESFEIVRLLENELPKSPFPVLDAMDRGSFEKLNKVPKIDKNSKSNTKKISSDCLSLLT